MRFRTKALAQNLAAIAVLAATMVIATIAALVAVPTPAAAYNPDPSVYWITQNAETCDRDLESDPADILTAIDDGSRCFIQANHEGFPYDFDRGGQNAVFSLWAFRGGEIGIVSFQAFAERLQVWDTANDGDAFYVWIDGQGPYFVPGTSNPRDIKKFDLNLTDGARHSIKITDDKDGEDVIASSAGALPYFIA
jgi:hypothetical protein